MSQPYLSLEAELHDAFWEAEEGESSEVPLMAAFLEKFSGRALEIGAGSGRLMFPLLEMGFDVEGLELSPDMLGLAEKRTARTGLRAVIHAGDMSSWNGGGKYNSLLAPAFTLQLADDPAATLRHWHGLLEENGGLYLSIFIPYAELLGDLPENEWYEDHRATLPDGREGLLETRHRFDHAHQLLEREHRYSLGSDPPVVHVSRQTIRWFEHREMMSLLAACGFRMDGYFLDFNPLLTAPEPDEIDFGGILTYHATRMPAKG